MKLASLVVDRRPLRIPAFRRLWTASAVCAIGGSFSLVAVPAQLFTLTGSSATVGLAAAVSMLALIVAALGSGARADVMDRRRLLLAGNVGLALAYAGLWLHAVLGLSSVSVLLILVALQGFSFGVTTTTVGAVVPRIVPTEHLVAANSLSSLTRYTGAVVGPLLAGVLIPVVGLGPLYLVDALALTGVVWAVAQLPAMPPTVHSGGSRFGFRYLAGHRVLLAVLGVDLAAMVCGMPVALYPELAERAYGGTAGGGATLGLLYAAYPIGVLGTGLLSGPLGRARRPGALLAGAAMVWGGCVMMLGLAPALGFALAALIVGGAVNFVLSTFRNAITQAQTDDAFRGRVQGTLTVVVMGGPQLANVVHGLGGAALGARWAVGLGGALTVVAVVSLVRAVPQLWHLEG